MGMADHDDVPVDVIWRPEIDGYAYFSPLAGWVKVDGERLRRHRVDFPWLLARLGRQLRIPRTFEPACLVKDILWELGPAWIGHRKHMTAVFLGRRLRHREVLEAACQALRERVNQRPNREETLCVDLEAGLKSVQAWRGDSISIRTFADAIDIACLIGGVDPAAPADGFFSAADREGVARGDERCAPAMCAGTTGGRCARR